MSYHPLGSMLRLMLRLMDVCFVLASLDALPEFGRLVWSVMDLIVLLFFLWLLLKTFLGETSVLDGLFDLLQYQHQAANIWFRV